MKVFSRTTAKKAIHETFLPRTIPVIRYGKGDSITFSLLKFKCNFTNDREVLQEYNEKIFKRTYTTANLMNLLTEVYVCSGKM